jgi:hypothetical protein
MMMMMNMILLFSNDVDDPCIDADVVFPNVDQCKSAIIRHTILHDHAFQIVIKG